MLVRWVRRSQLTLGGAVFGALWVSLVEARAAGALDTDLPPLGPLFLAALGLVAPLALVVGLVVAVASLFFEPGEVSSPRSCRSRSSSRTECPRATRAEEVRGRSPSSVC